VTDRPPVSGEPSRGQAEVVSFEDVEAAMKVVRSSRLTHVHWAEWRRNGGTGDDMAGDLEHHEDAIRDYDLVLKVLRSYRDDTARAQRDDELAAMRAEARATPPSLDADALQQAVSDHCHDSVDEGLPIRLRHKHLGPFLTGDCGAAIAREYARLTSKEERCARFRHDEHCAH